MITGLGIVAPNGIGKNAFWRSLIAGESAVDFITSFDTSAYPCKVAAEVKNFHPTDFMNARTAKVAGRFSQFAIAATRLALEDSKLSIDSSLSPSTSICYGTSVNGAGDIAAKSADAFRLNGVKALDPWAALEYPPHAAASYVAIEFGIKGPAVSVSSNCCTGIDAIALGTSQIQSNVASVALVGACDAPLFPLSFAGFCALGALSKRSKDPQKASRPYDLLRDGLVLGEGAATLVLEDFEYATARGAKIYAEVLGHAGASEAIGMRKGDIEGAVMATAIRRALAAAALAPEDIDHINAHGSSLPDYDVCDTNGFKKSLGSHAYKIPITSIKSMIGQPVSAAGAFQTAAACLSLEAQFVPPTINQEVRDLRCDLDYVPNAARIARLNRILINGHSFGGSVAALVIGKADPTN
ncbi:MAG TPA: beta-ketoacyl synthase N-terminal-like domain-containing protein [Methylomirabilota bacterium]